MLHQPIDDALIYYFKGSAHYDDKDYRAALADFTKAIELNTDYDDAYFTRGETYLKLGQKKEALSDFKRAIELGKSIPNWYLNACR